MQAMMNEKPETGEASSSDLDQKELRLVKENLTSEQIAFVIETLKKKAPFDEIPIKQLLYGMLSAFSKIPIPHNVEPNVYRIQLNKY
jgi:hypothetical protein